MYTLHNPHKGARFVGGVLVEAGDTVEVELTDEEALAFADILEVQGEKARRGRPPK